MVRSKLHGLSFLWRLYRSGLPFGCVGRRLLVYGRGYGRAHRVLSVEFFDGGTIGITFALREEESSLVKRDGLFHLWFDAAARSWRGKTEMFDLQGLKLALADDDGVSALANAA